MAGLSGGRGLGTERARAPSSFMRNVKEAVGYLGKLDDNELHWLEIKLEGSEWEKGKARDVLERHARTAFNGLSLAEQHRWEFMDHPPAAHKGAPAPEHVPVDWASVIKQVQLHRHRQ